LFEGHPERLRSFAKLVANPHSWSANSAFRRHLSAGPTPPTSRAQFANRLHAKTVRISARVDDCGELVVENSRGIKVSDHGVQRNDFNYKLVGQEISLEPMLRDRSDLARSLAMTIRYPGSAAVQRSFTRQISNQARRSEPSLTTLSQEWASRSLSVEQGAGVEVGIGNSRTDTVSVKIGRLVMTGWDSSAIQVAAEIDQQAPARPVIDPPMASPDPARRPVAPAVPYRHRPATPTHDRDDLDDLDPPSIHGPAIGPW
jgi:hypothetical protein